MRRNMDDIKQSRQFYMNVVEEKITNSSDH